MGIAGIVWAWVPTVCRNTWGDTEPAGFIVGTRVDPTLSCFGKFNERFHVDALNDDRIYSVLVNRKTLKYRIVKW